LSKVPSWIPRTVGWALFVGAPIGSALIVLVRVVLNAVSSVQAGASVVSEMQKGDLADRALAAVASWPPWLPGIVLIAAFAVGCYLLVFRRVAPQLTTPAPPPDGPVAIADNSEIKRLEAALHATERAVRSEQDKVSSLMTSAQEDEVESTQLRHELKAEIERHKATESQKDAREQELRAARKERDAAQASLVAVEPRASKWDQVAPIALAYRTTSDLAARLDALVKTMDARIPKKADIHSAVDQYLATAEVNSKEFDEGYRQDLIRAVADVRSRFGLIDARLTDEALAGYIAGGLGVQPFIEGLNTLAAELSKMLTKAAANQ